MGNMRNEYKLLSWNLEGKVSLGRPRNIQEDNIKRNLSMKLVSPCSSQYHW
jgi:hypothetical protein